MSFLRWTTVLTLAIAWLGTADFIIAGCAVFPAEAHDGWHRYFYSHPAWAIVGVMMNVTFLAFIFSQEPR